MKLMERELTITLTNINIQVNLKMVKRMERESILMKKEIFMMEV